MRERSMFDARVAVLFAAALLMLAAQQTQGQKPKKPDGKTPEKLEDGRIVLRGARVVLANPPTGSYCADAATPITEEIKLGAVTLTPTKDDVVMVGPATAQKASMVAGAYTPGKKAPAADKKTTLKAGDLAKGIDVELFGDDGGRALVRIERTWRGLTYGVLSGWSFVIDKETLYVVDADLDGKVSTGDCMLYGASKVWMPFHTFTASGATWYSEIAPHEDDALACKTARADLPQSDAAFFDEWNNVRKSQGIPPGGYEKEWSANCVKHADYLKRNKLGGHEEDPNLPGYTPEGATAGFNSCLTVLSGSAALAWFMRSAYHRDALVDPVHCYLQFGGNGYRFLMTGAQVTSLVTEERSRPQAQRYPAAGTVVPGAYSEEQPENPALKQSKKLGLPVSCYLHSYEPGVVDKVECKLYVVAGDLRSGKRDKAVMTFLSYPGYRGPEGIEGNLGQVMLTPLAPLGAGIYEADFKFDHEGQSSHYNWRFEVAK